MKIIGLTDIHGNGSGILKLADELKSVDAVVLSGDITHFGRALETSEIINGIRFFNSQVFAVPGNCDYPEAGEYLTGEGFNLHGESRFFQDITFMGLGGSLPCPGKTPNEYYEHELDSFLKHAVQQSGTDSSLILVSHQPPFNTLNDRIGLQQHVGSEAVRRFIEQYQPLLCFCGHIHEGVGIDEIGRTKTINPGPVAQGLYAYAEISGKEVTRLEIRSMR